MKIYIPNCSKGSSAAYLAEILSAEGLCYYCQLSLEEILKRANPTKDILLLPAGRDSSAVVDYLKAGGRVVAIQPQRQLAAAIGLTPTETREGQARLRMAERVCLGTRGESLWTQGTYQLYQLSEGARTAAYLFFGEYETPGIIRCFEGHGKAIAYAYDPALAIARLRQGDPRRANHLPPGQATPRAAFLQPPSPPEDSFWKPTADLHGRILCQLIRSLVEDRAPMPRLWYFPAGAPSLLLFSGDEDGALQEECDAEMRDVEAADGSMTLYVIPDRTSITSDHIKSYISRGHAVSVHPNLTTAAGQSCDAQLELAERQVRLFQEKFDHPVRTLRNHSYMWPGYVKLPELWERLGVGMDANVTSMMRGESFDFGPYARLNAALPMRYVREDGRVIDVFQQPTQLNDDLLTNPTSSKSYKYSLEEFSALTERCIDDSVRVYHSPLCINFHPSNFSRFSGTFGREVLRLANEAGVSVWSLDRWHDFWRARSKWRVYEAVRFGSGMLYTLQGPPVDGLIIELPVSTGCWKIIRISGKSCPVSFTEIDRGGWRSLQIPIPNGVREVKFSVDFQNVTTEEPQI